MLFCTTLLLFTSFVINTESKLENILLIVVDDLRPSLGCFGDTQAVSPNIDHFCSESVVFHRAYAQQALCAPSRNSFLTSRRPDTLHLYDFYNYWRNFTGNFTTMPQHFKENKYETFSIGKVFHPGISSGNADDYPLSWTVKPWHPPTEAFKNAATCHDKHGGWVTNIVCPVLLDEQPSQTLPDLQIVEKAKEYLNSRTNKTQPFFLAVGFHKPHIPLKFPRQYLDFHPIQKVSTPDLPFYPPGLPTVSWNPWTDLRWRHDIKNLNLTFPFESMPDTWIKLIRQAYYASVTYIDDLVGQLLHELALSGHDMDTIVALIGDHACPCGYRSLAPSIIQCFNELLWYSVAQDKGIDTFSTKFSFSLPIYTFRQLYCHRWSLGEHGEWSKYSNFEVSVRVPFILRIPSVTYNRNTELPKTSGFHTKELVELVDLFPTLADLSGVPKVPLCPMGVPESNFCSEGISMTPLIHSIVKEQKENDIYFQQYELVNSDCIKQIEDNNSSFSIKWKKAVFSQYPRPGVTPTHHPNSDKPRLKEISIMGYSMRTKQHRFTLWVKWNPDKMTPDWSKVVATELYDHFIDPEENLNLADRNGMEQLEATLTVQLKNGWRKALPDIIC